MNDADVKNILGLKLPTDPRWVNLAEKSMEEILTDHAFCEQKAATTCISLIQKFSTLEKLVIELSPIVTEEWGHFRQVLASMVVQRRSIMLKALRLCRPSCGAVRLGSKALAVKTTTVQSCSKSPAMWKSHALLKKKWVSRFAN